MTPISSSLTTRSEETVRLRGALKTCFERPAISNWTQRENFLFTQDTDTSRASIPKTDDSIHTPSDWRNRIRSSSGEPSKGALHDTELLGTIFRRQTIASIGLRAAL